jgi:hypothetical protein
MYFVPSLLLVLLVGALHPAVAAPNSTKASPAGGGFVFVQGDVLGNVANDTSFQAGFAAGISSDLAVSLAQILRKP